MTCKSYVKFITRPVSHSRTYFLFVLFVLFVLKIQPSKVCSTEAGGPNPVFKWMKEETKQKSQNVVRE